MTPQREENTSRVVISRIVSVYQSLNLDTIHINGYTQTDASSLTMRTELIFISMAARRLGMHPQTLRKYERLGLIRPTRTIGSMRLYSNEQIQRLRLIKRLVDELGINLAGVQQLLSIAEIVERMRPLVAPGHPSRNNNRGALQREINSLVDLLGIDK